MWRDGSSGSRCHALPVEVNRLLRCAVGVGLGECLVIALWQADMLAEPKALIQFIAGRFQNAWAMRFTAGDYEIGHWNHLRLRQLAASRSRQQRGGVGMSPMEKL